MLVRRIISAVVASFVAVLTGWIAGILFALVWVAVTLVPSHDHATLGEFIALPIVVGIASLYFVIPVWLVVLVPLYLFVPHSWPLWRWSICTALGAISGMCIVLAFLSRPGVNPPQNMLSWYILAAVIGGTTCLVGSLIRARSRAFHARI